MLPFVTVLSSQLVERELMKYCVQEDKNNSFYYCTNSPVTTVSTTVQTAMSQQSLPLYSPVTTVSTTVQSCYNSLYRCTNSPVKVREGTLQVLHHHTGPAIGTDITFVRHYLCANCPVRVREGAVGMQRTG